MNKIITIIHINEFPPISWCEGSPNSENSIPKNDIIFKHKNPICM